MQLSLPLSTAKVSPSSLLPEAQDGSVTGIAIAKALSLTAYASKADSW